ncbi:hypothetical protein BJ875DRAFT_483753 [Amylocarpus encephaloides]|uniref:Uncharacterized protein n=1 Tax=Amylocarpus encephaloides TaxID=45428 RepID=A0A9P7YJA9_9HELO|nr:hypothetical protein BJ875DRAFT_483753 [Amylocarpus encephaloides]
MDSTIIVTGINCDPITQRWVLAFGAVAGPTPPPFAITEFSTSTELSQWAIHAKNREDYQARLAHDKSRIIDSWMTHEAIIGAEAGARFFRWVKIKLRAETSAGKRAVMELWQEFCALPCEQQHIEDDLMEAFSRGNEDLLHLPVDEPVERALTPTEFPALDLMSDGAIVCCNCRRTRMQVGFDGTEALACSCCHVKCGGCRETTVF